MSLKGVIFDLDGVLVDTVPLHYSAWLRMFEEYGQPFDEKIYREKVDGRPRVDGVRNVMVTSDEVEILEAAETKQRYYLELIDRGFLRSFETALPLIRDLRARDVLLATASSSTNAEAILDKVGVLDAFAVVVTAADITFGKPDPEIFTTAARRMGLSNAECAVVEDAEVGVAAAKRGGFACVGVDRHSQPGYFVGADLVVEDLSEVDFGVLNRLVTA